MPDVTDADLSYAAGFLDGDGSIQIHSQRSPRRNPFYSLVVSAANADLSLLEWMQSLFGGDIHHLAPKVGYQRRFAWRVTGIGAESLLRRVRPWLRVKRVQAWLGLEFGAQRTVYNHSGVELPIEELAIRAGFHRAMHLLNHPPKD